MLAIIPPSLKSHGSIFVCIEAYVLFMAEGFTDDCAFVCDNQYGGEEHLDAPPRELLLAQTEDYVEYSRHGAVLKGLEKAVARSKYEEDVLINNHIVRMAEHAV